MINCPKCGAELNEGSKFCTTCGLALSDNREYGGFQPQQQYQKKSNTGLIVGIVVISVVLVLLIGVLVSVLVTRGTNKPVVIEEDPVLSVEKIPENKEPAKIEKTTAYDVQEAINSYISNHASHGDISVAVIDNRTRTKISSTGSRDRYVAWGFYLPVYLAYKEGYGYPDGQLLGRILSSDAGVCNQAANTAIDLVGGLGAVNDVLYYTYSCRDTSYGRYFGKSSVSGDNYTTADEAASMLLYYNTYDNRSNLSYNASNYGISVPGGASYNAQIGTENNSVRNNLNVFAIARGQYSDYCVVVLSRNNAGKNNMSGLLSLIHSKMEEMSR